MIVLIAIATLALVSNVFATKDPYDSGYDHGCDDASKSPSNRYINEDGKGPSDHTQQFMNGYYDGFNACDNEGPESGQAQAQSSSNTNTNTNSLSQSQATTIYVCKEGGCTAQ